MNSPRLENPTNIIRRFPDPVRAYHVFFLSSIWLGVPNSKLKPAVARLRSLPGYTSFNPDSELP